MWGIDILELAQTGYLRSPFMTSIVKDLNVINAIKKQLTKYRTRRTLNVRLLANNIILLFNCFSPKVAKYILYNSIPGDVERSILKTCMIKIDFMIPEEWINIPIDKDIEILLNQTIR